MAIVVHGSWRPFTVFAGDLASTPGGAARAGRLLAWMAASSVVNVNVIRIPDSTPSAQFAMDKGSYVLASPYWSRVERLAGPPGADAMSSDANAQCPGTGGPQLLHFTRYPSERSGGVNVFSQSLRGLNVYCNPVFALIAALLSHLRAQRAVASMIVPGWYGSIPSAPWWPILVSACSSRVLLAPVGSVGVFSTLPADRPWAPAGPLPWDVWLFRLDFSSEASGPHAVAVTGL